MSIFPPDNFTPPGVRNDSTNVGGIAHQKHPFLLFGQFMMRSHQNLSHQTGP
jgi:hypothetical protein